jgi:prevent-host-death family protein
MQTSIGVFEAKTHLSRLLERAERGEEIIITRHGKPVAKLGPVRPGHDVEAARAAAARLRALAKEMKLGPFNWEEWKRYRDAGRR